MKTLLTVILLTLVGCSGMRTYKSSARKKYFEKDSNGNYTNTLKEMPVILNEKEVQWLKDTYYPKSSADNSWLKERNYHKNFYIANLFRNIEQRIRTKDFTNNRITIPIHTFVNGKYDSKEYRTPTDFTVTYIDLKEFIKNQYEIHDEVYSMHSRSYMIIGDGTVLLSYYPYSITTERGSGSLRIESINSKLPLNFESLIARDTLNQDAKEEIITMEKELTRYWGQAYCSSGPTKCRAIPGQRRCSCSAPVYHSSYYARKSRERSGGYQKQTGSGNSLTNAFASGFISGMNEINQMKRDHIVQMRKNYQLINKHNNDVRQKEQRDREQKKLRDKQIAKYKEDIKRRQQEESQMHSQTSKFDEKVQLMENDIMDKYKTWMPRYEPHYTITKEELENAKTKKDLEKDITNKSRNSFNRQDRTSRKNNSLDSTAGTVEQTKKTQQAERGYAACYATPSGKNWLCDGPFQKLYAPEPDLNRALELAGCQNNMLESKTNGVDELEGKTIHVYNCNKNLGTHDRVIRLKKEYGLTQ